MQQQNMQKPQQQLQLAGLLHTPTLAGLDEHRHPHVLHATRHCSLCTTATKGKQSLNVL